MRFLSVCSGIEAASLAWNPLGWETVAFSEIEPFPSAVLQHRFPHVPNRGDMTRHAEWDIDSPDVLVGGTPCQSFSVAGLRAGMDDPRGNLALVFLEIARRLRPRWVVWENVPGVLSSAGGRDFGSFLGGMVECGYGFAYRVLDAQFAGVPQRRRRVFVVGHLGDWRGAAAVLLERSSLQGHPPPRRESREGVAGAVARSLRGRGNSSHREDSDTFLAHSLRGEGFDASQDGTGRGTPLVSFALNAKGGSGRSDGESETLIAFDARQTPVHANDCSLPLGAKDIGHGIAVDGYNGAESDLQPTIGVNCGVSTGRNGVRSGMSVRRLTPREYERLQGMPDDWTLVPYRGKPSSDGPRYKAIGNSIAVPVLRWIGERIRLVEAEWKEA